MKWLYVLLLIGMLCTMCVADDDGGWRSNWQADANSPNSYKGMAASWNTGKMTDWDVVTFDTIALHKSDVEYQYINGELYRIKRNSDGWTTSLVKSLKPWHKKIPWNTIIHYAGCAMIGIVIWAIALFLIYCLLLPFNIRNEATAAREFAELNSDKLDRILGHRDDAGNIIMKGKTNEKD